MPTQLRNEFGRTAIRGRPRRGSCEQLDLTKLDFVVLSHRHSDHVGGVSYLLSVNPKVRIYAPKEGFGIFGSELLCSGYLAIVIFILDWVQRWALAPFRASNPIAAPP